MRNIQAYSVGLVAMVIFYVPCAWAQWQPDVAPAAASPKAIAPAVARNTDSPFSLGDPGQVSDSVEVEVARAGEESESPFSLPKEQAEAVSDAVTETSLPESGSPFALPDEETGADTVTPQPEAENVPDTNAPTSPFSLPPESASAGVDGVDVPVSTQPPAVQPDPVEPEEAPQSLSAEALREKGTALAREKKYDQAREMLALSLEKDPESVVTLNNLGLVMRKLGRMEEAVQAYVFAIQLDEQYALTYKNLGILLENQGENETAVEAYRKYVQLAPKAGDAADVTARADWLEQQK